MLKNAKKSIVGVLCNVSLKIMGRAQNKAKNGQNLQPHFMKRSSVTRKIRFKSVQSHQLFFTIVSRTI